MSHPALRGWPRGRDGVHLRRRSAAGRAGWSSPRWLPCSSPCLALPLLALASLALRDSWHRSSSRRACPAAAPRACSTLVVAQPGAFVLYLLLKLLVVVDPARRRDRRLPHVLPGFLPSVIQTAFQPLFRFERAYPSCCSSRWVATVARASHRRRRRASLQRFFRTPAAIPGRAAAARPPAGRVGERLPVLGLKLEDLPVARLGPEASGPVDVAEEEVGLDSPRVLAHDVLEVGLGPARPLRVLHAGVSQGESRADAQLAPGLLQRRLDLLDGLPVVPVLEELLPHSDRLGQALLEARHGRLRPRWSDGRPARRGSSGAEGAGTADPGDVAGGSRTSSGGAGGPVLLRRKSRS